MTPERVDKVFESHILRVMPVEEFTMRHAAHLVNSAKVVSICGGAGCARETAPLIRDAFLRMIERAGLSDKIAVTEATCQGRCKEGPLAYVYPDGVSYKVTDTEAVERIVTEHFLNDKVVNDLMWVSDRVANRFFPVFGDVGFFGRQLRVTLRNCGVIDPESFDEYLSVRGYEAIAQVLTEMSPDQVIEEIIKSGLRGRGGGGFSTGLKWKIGRETVSDVKYFVCNADEGDPGAFMDRSAIESDPHSIIEGMMIGAYALGAKQGYIYIRAEYPLAIQRLRIAIEDARAAGLLGENILGSGVDFDLEIRLGAGAFVCGEETALINSIEGKRGQPDPRPPYPSVSGLWGKPTIINNVETLANIPVIILDGAEWLTSLGTEKSSGTKVFALAGDVVNTGLIEVPMGSTLRDVVYGVGGGVKGGGKLKAVQTGGPAGGCLPESMLDTPIDYDTLAAAGSIMGSGGMIVMDEKSCMVNVAKFFLDFTQDESCGKCTPCREGTKRMLEILTRISEGRGVEGDIEKLLRLSETVKKASLCGLGQAAPNPVISTIKHFREEYEAHIKEKRCPAGACKELITYVIDPKNCIGCGVCKRKCPVACISGGPKEVHVINQDECIKCGTCLEVCRFSAVERR
ncbi:MAG: NADH-quinone oxidoreductase subunit NuoF [Lentisphaerae bacterium]|nr:NADH-quinone oxidoreductase subunit NuoF [Lentisphaerota bacterium]